MNSRDAFVSPPLDLSGVSAATLEFDFAYKQRDMGLSDSLILYYSLDCGQTFSKLRYWHGMGSLGLSTAPAFPDNFVPQTASEWCGVLQASAPCAVIDLTELLGNHSVVFKWEGVCKNGNNIYLTGETGSNSEIASSGAWDIVYSGLGDAFLSKFSNFGKRVWATYFGGSSTDIGFAVTFVGDSTLKLYVTGKTYSASDISTTGSWDTLYGGIVEDGIFGLFLLACVTAMMMVVVEAVVVAVVAASSC
jgi:hypothetical protein